MKTMRLIPLETPVDLSLDDRRLIQLAAERCPDRHRYVELAVLRRLNGGFSGARVLEAEWRADDRGSAMRSVIKLDRVGRLRDETLLTARFGAEAPSFARVVATSFSADTEDTEAGCLLYSHGQGLFPGELRSLTELCRDALAASPGDLTEPRLRVREALAILVKQLHRGRDALRQESGSLQLDFYLRRWRPTATLDVRQVAWQGKTTLRLFLADEATGPEIEPGLDPRADEERLGQPVVVEGHELLLLDGAVYVNRPYEAAFVITGIPAETIASALAGKVPERIRVEGKLKETRHGFYARKLQEPGLDPGQEQWQLGGVAWPNPLPGFWERAGRWANRRPLPLYGFGHGDLHGGNVLLVGNHLFFIDHAQAGEDHPRWADAARLIGTLWRDAIAPQLAPEEIAQALHQAFRASASGGEGKVAAAADFLRDAFEAALAAAPAADPTTSSDAARELWVDLHHFAWIGLKWPGSPANGLAMALLAAVAAEQADVADQKVALARTVAREVPAVFGPSGDLAQAPRIFKAVYSAFSQLDNSRRDLFFQLREELHRIEAGQMAQMAAASGVEHPLLTRLLERALTGVWNELDTQDAMSFRQSLDPVEGRYDRIVLVDALLFACGQCWRDDAFGLLLDLAQDGVPEVEAEVALALGWLLSLESTWQALESKPILHRRLEHLAARPEWVRLVAWVGQVRIEAAEQVMSVVGGFPEVIRSWLAAGRYTLWLRPFDAKFDLASEEASRIAPEVLELLRVNSNIWSPAKRWIAQSLLEADEAQRNFLLVRLMSDESRLQRIRPAHRSIFGRMADILTLLRHLDERGGRWMLWERRRTFERSFADLLINQELRALLLARELSARAALAHVNGKLVSAEQLSRKAVTAFRELPASGLLEPEDFLTCGLVWSRLAQLSSDPTKEQRLRGIAIKHYQQAVEQGFYDALCNCGYEFGELARLSAAESKEERRLREAAIEQYQQAVMTEAESPELLFLWGYQLGQLARLSSSVAEEEHRLREAAIEKYRQAMKLKADYPEALNNWGIELGELARLATTSMEERRLRKAAIKQFRQAIAKKPDFPEVLNNWGFQLSQLSRLCLEPTEERRLRRAAIKQYQQAVRVKPHYPKALVNWAFQLDELARLATAEPAQERRLREEACEKREAALVLQAGSAEELSMLAWSLVRLALLTPQGAQRDVLLDRGHQRLKESAALRNRPLTQLYDYACCLALQRRREEALASLEECLAAGTVSRAHVEKDSDWDELRENPEFLALLARFSATPPASAG